MRRIDTCGFPVYNSQMLILWKFFFTLFSEPEICVASVFGTPGDKLSGTYSACSGEKLEEFEYGIAHRKLPCGTKVIIKNRKTQRFTLAKVVDRGPYGAGTPGLDWYIKRKQDESPPEDLCHQLNDANCLPRPWRGCIDLLPGTADLIGLSGRSEVKMWVLR